MKTSDEGLDDADMAEVGRGNEGGTVIDAGNEIGPGALGDEQLDHIGVAVHGSDGKRVVFVVFQQCAVGAGLHEGSGCGKVARECCDHERRAAIGVADIDIRFPGDQPADLGSVAGLGGGVQSGKGGALTLGWRHLGPGVGRQGNTSGGKEHGYGNFSVPHAASPD